MAKFIPMQHSMPGNEPSGYVIKSGMKEVRYGVVTTSETLRQPEVEEVPYVSHKEELTIEKILNPLKPVIVEKPKEVELDKEQQKQKEIEESQKAGYNGILHKVGYTDTLDGLSIKYGISKESIRMENCFLGDEIYMFKTIKIPFAKKVLYEKTDKFDEEKQKKLDKYDMMMELIKRTYECDGRPQKSYREEARYYLESSGYEFDAAVKEFSEDYKFEKQNKHKMTKLDKLCHNK